MNGFVGLEHGTIMYRRLERMSNTGNNIVTPLRVVGHQAHCRVSAGYDPRVDIFIYIFIDLVKVPTEEKHMHVYNNG